MGLSLLPRNENKTLTFLGTQEVRSRIRTLEIILTTPLVPGSFFRDAIESQRRTSILVFKAKVEKKFRSRTKVNLGSTWEAKCFRTLRISFPINFRVLSMMTQGCRCKAIHVNEADFEWLMSMPSLEARRLCIKINNIWIKLLKSPTPGSIPAAKKRDNGSENDERDVGRWWARKSYSFFLSTTFFSFGVFLGLGRHVRDS